MDRINSSFCFRLAATWLMAVTGCSSDTATTKANLPSLHDITDAPAPIQTAARSVVRIGTAGAMATGSFISATGLLLTNNHVLGAPVCAREGCWVQLTLMHQNGTPWQAPLVVYAVPQTVDIGLDMAVLQLYDDKDGAMLETPDFLTIVPRDSASLVGTHVTVVGHPEGRLKKWSDGTIYDPLGAWFFSSAYALSGDSGSPVLDDDGHVVGLLHRTPTSQDLITSNSVNEFSIGTSSAPIMAAMSAPLPTAVMSTAADTTAESVVGNNVVYLNARAATANIGSAPVAVLSLLAQACDAGLAQQDFQSIDDFTLALGPCDEAIRWIECRTDASPVPYGVLCPPTTEAPAWENRFAAMNTRSFEVNGQLDLYPVTFGAAHLATSTSAGQLAGNASLQQVLDTTAPVLDFSLANYLAAFDIGAYATTNLTAYVIGYGDVVHYERQASSIVSAAAWLRTNGWLRESDFRTLVAQLHDDPNVTVGAKLYIEEIQYYYQ